MVVPVYEEARSGVSRWGRGSPAKLRREVRLRSMGDSLAVEVGDGDADGGAASLGWGAAAAVRLRLSAGWLVGVAGVQGLTERQLGLRAT